MGDPDRVAISVDGNDSLTYTDLRHQRNRYVDVLTEAAVGPGDRVGIMLLNSLDYVALYFAIARIGAIAVRLNFRLSPDELEYVINDAGCSVVVMHTSRVSQLEPIRNRVQVTTWFSLVDGENPIPQWAPEPPLAKASIQDSDRPRPTGTDPLMLMYTSGTTGRPKGVIWTHDNALWLAANQSVKWSYTTRTVSLTTGPLYHAGAFEVLLLPALYVHGTAVTMSSGGLTTRRIVEAIARTSATHVMLYPFQLYELLRDETLQQLGSVTRILTGGDPVAPWALDTIDKKFPDVELQNAYGLTEGGTMSTCLDHVDRYRHPNSVGRPMPLTEVRTVGEDGTALVAGGVGEVWVRSPTVTAGYWNKPEATAETFVDGWLRTGDLGRITDDGFLILTGRAKDMIRSGGENIYPAEVEAVLASHPNVSAIAVVAVPNATYLEVGCAIVVRSELCVDRSEAQVEHDLRAFARQKLAGYKTPRHYVFVKELPINASGKVQKHLLRSRYATLGSEVEPVSATADL
ncbi:class I adenylate-forming enzyme family protein [Rhodococcus erythropolis]|uniref:class I adenylate-forming enzyme family protein n=1 Tax=Rhodococcus erythropolis TaxID=1833 RepID=UPI00382436EF